MAPGLQLMMALFESLHIPDWLCVWHYKIYGEIEFINLNQDVLNDSPRYLH